MADGNGFTVPEDVHRDFDRVRALLFELGATPRILSKTGTMALAIRCALEHLEEKKAAREGARMGR
jgi:hypothetical protein